jgi:hypothetical protein
VRVFEEESLRNSWQPVESGRYRWRGNELAVSISGSEWGGVELNQPWPGLLYDTRNLLIQLFVSGEAELAGLSFGPYRDFLTPVDTSPSTAHCLQLELDRGAGRWLFRVDGRVQPRQWWDGAIGGLSDIFAGALTLKTKKPREAFFRGLTIYSYESECRVSVVMTCYRFLQRLRVTLGSWVRQSADTGSFEVIVVNPESPDGVSEHIAAVAASCPHFRIREVMAPASLARNKGALINRGVRASSGAWIWLCDSDCLFDRDAVNKVFAFTGTADGIASFARLRQESHVGETQPYGYTQIVPRDVLIKYPYREDINHYADSDLSFAERCRRDQIRPTLIEGLCCLHLSHPFAWYGAPAFL